MSSTTGPVPRLTALVVAYVGVYVAFSLSSWGSPDTRALIDAVAVVLPGILATIAMALASKRSASDRRTGLAWRWLAVSSFLLTAGYALMAYYQAHAGAVPFPSLADVFLLAYYPCFLIGVLCFPSRAESRAGAIRLAVDATTILIGGASVVWFLVVGPTLTATSASGLAGAVSGAYPVGDLLQIFAMAYLLMRTLAPALRRPLALLVLANVVVTACDVVNGWSLLHVGSSPVAAVDIGFMVAWALFILGPVTYRGPDAGATQRGAVDEPGESRPLVSRARWLPYVAPAVVLGLLIHAQFGSPLYQRVGLTICAALVAVLVMLRQYLAQRDLFSAQRELSYRALHDSLTELPNRALVLDRAEQLLARAERELRPVAALHVDLDGFKHVNDTFGHAAGDELLKTVAARLSSIVRGSDTVGRLGGDAVLLLDSPNLDAGPQFVAERLLAVLRQPIELADASGRPICVTASLGIAIAASGTADELLRNADMELYRGKAAGKDRVVTFESSMQAAAADRLLLEMDLRDAIGAGQLFLLYQPTVDLQTETVTGVEALLRWRHPTRGVVPPDAFIGLAEDGGLIVPIGRWVLDEACRQAAAWHVSGRVIGMAVNVSTRQLDSGHIVDDVSAALAGSGLDPAALTLEITETALMRDPAATAEVLAALKGLGVRIAVDDFGTGYSSMAYLRQFPVDALKIDRSFISGGAATKESDALIHTLIQLGKALDLETVGEGIEETAQLRHLQCEQCDSGQGFLFARPMPPHAIERFLKDAMPSLVPAP